MPAVRAAAGLVAVLLGLGAAAQDAAVLPGPGQVATTLGSERVERDHWYILRLDEQPVGWMRRARIHVTDGEQETLVRTERRTHMHLQRAGESVVLETESRFVETRDGAPRSAGTRTRSGDAASEIRWRFTDEGIVEQREEDGRVTERTRPHPGGDWLTPAAADLLVAARIEAGATRIEWRTLDPEAGLVPGTLVMEADGRTRTMVEGRSVPATRWRVRSSAAPGLETTQLRSQGGHLLAETTPTPVGRLTAELTSEEAARAAVAGPAPEVMGPSLIVPEGRIDRAWRRIRYAVRRDEPGQEDADADTDTPPIPAGGPQTIEAGEDGWWTLRVDPRGDAAGDAAPGPGDLEAGPLIDATDPVVQRLVARAVRRLVADAPVRARAEAMRRRVGAHITEPGLDRLFDSASRTARSRRGDCSEHAVLLAAMLRAADIPARVAVGLVHADRFAGEESVFVWHMWTRAWYDGRWHDLDATRRDGFGPTHIRVSDTSGAAGVDGAMLGELAGTLASVGRLRIRVLGGER